MNRIAYIVSTFRKSGPTNQLFNMLKYLNRDLFEPHVITLSPEPENSMKLSFESLGCSLYSLHYNRIEGFIYAKRKLNDLFHKINPVLVHTQGIRGDSLCQSIVNKNKHILSIRNFPSEDYITKFGFFKGSLFALKHFNVIKKARHAIACSKMLATKFEAKKGITLQYIQNGVDTDDFIPLHSISDKKHFKKQYGFESSNILFITVGNLIPRKNITTIINAFMLNKHNDFRLIVLGEGSEEKKLKYIAKGDNRIHFPGYSNKVVEYLQMSDYFISSSLSEGLPNSVLEAMACGLPVILSDISSHRELSENSKNFKFFKPQDHLTLHHFLNELPDNRWNSISLTMKRIVHQNFSARVMSEKYQKLYKMLIKDKYTDNF